MIDIKDKIKTDVEKLVKDGRKIFCEEQKKTEDITIKTTTLYDYQIWYSVALALVKQTLPERVDEFQELYLCKKRKVSEISYLTYGISDYFLGLNVTRGINKEPIVDSLTAFLMKFQQQVTIVLSILGRINSTISDIKGTIQAEMFDSELEAAYALIKNGFLRAAGALAGVILERHFEQVLKNHELKIAKSNPTIADYNEFFKSSNIYDIIQWRFIQHLGDIRNLCVHKKEREPTEDEVKELLVGTDKIIKTIF
jgi:hypothetical protein